VEKMKTWNGERFKKTRKIRKVSQAELAKKLGVSQASISAWEVNANAPSEDRLDEIQKILKVNINYLFGISNNPELTPLNIDENLKLKNCEIQILHEGEERKLAVYANVSAGHGSPATDEIIDYAYSKFGDFALKVRGESMLPSVRDGDIIIAKKISSTTELKNGDMVIAIINHDDAVIKRWYYYPDLNIFSLYSENRTQFLPMNFPAYRLGNDIHIAGKVIEIRTTPENI
jgi:repressor LexA